MTISKYTEKCSDQLYLVFRVLVGFLFFTHGSGKVLGWFGGPGIGVSGLMGIVGLAELLIGLAILLGFYTRLAALGGVVIMATAFFWKHFSIDLVGNNGELAVLYLACFLVVLSLGAQKWSLEQKLLKKETF